MLRSELVRLLQKLSESHSTKKDRTAFLINNVNAIIGVLREVCVYNALCSAQSFELAW